MQFASGNWDKHMGSLKPLGLNILLNNNCLQPEKALMIADHSAHIDTRERGGDVNEQQAGM